MHTHSSEDLYAFTLGREQKLSLAELVSLFGHETLREYDDEIAIFSIPESDIDIHAIFRNIGGSIRVIRILSETDEKRFPTDVIREIGSPEGKYTFALGVYGGEFRLSDIGLRIKKTLSEHGVSSRLVNTENKNIISAVWKKEKLGRSKSEYNLINIKGYSYLGVTIACQDIDAYAKRDTSKSRDMIVGMMPPKLCQMMINIARGSISKNTLTRISLYDPFCGLGTILIEGANMGITKIYGSDISPRMVSSTEKSLRDFITEENVWHERIRAAGGTPTKDYRDFRADIFELDASKIQRGKVPAELSGESSKNTLIVSEGYLGEIMGKETITESRIRQEKAKLKIMYDGFFSGLVSLDFSGTIVMTFPFWNIHGESYLFTEIYDVIGRHGWDIIPLLPDEDMRTMLTPKGSLLYRRPDQIVGREVIKIRKR